MQVSHISVFVCMCMHLLGLIKRNVVSSIHSCTHTHHSYMFARACACLLCMHACVHICHEIVCIGLTTDEEVKGALHSAAEGRRVLLVLDDIWTVEQEEAPDNTSIRMHTCIHALM